MGLSVKKAASILISILLSACAAATSTPPATPKTMETVTPEARNTPTVAVTVTAQLSTSTLMPTKTATADLTQGADAAVATEMAVFSITCDSSQYKYLSPDKNWLAINCPKKQNSTLEIVNKQGKRWVLALKDYVEKHSNGDIPPGGFQITHWSNDGAYLYFSPSLGLSGGGDPCVDDFGGYGLYRIKLNDGNMATVLPMPKSFFGYHVAFSPTDRQLAYEGDAGVGLIIRDLQTGEEITTHDHGTTGDAIWSKDGATLVYSTCTSSWDGTFRSIEKSAVKRYTISTNISKTILEKEKSLLFIENWNANNILKISITNENGTLEQQFFDLNNNQWVTSTPTPQKP